MEIKGSKQLYHKLFFIYTAILVCAISALVIFFLNSTKNRFLEQSLSYTEMMSEDAVSYLEDTSDIAEYIHEDLYNSSMELNDVLHYLTDEPDVYLQHRLDTYIANKNSEYKGVDKFFLDAFQAYGSLSYISLFSYGREEITEYTRDGKSYRRTQDEKFKKCFEEGCLVEEDCFAYLKEIRDPTTMQVKGCMILWFKSKKFESIWQYYSSSELIVYQDAGTVVYDSSKEHEISAIKEAENKGALEDLLLAYVEQGQYGEYHTISYLEKKRAAAIPVSIVVMFLLVGIAVMVFGELFVRYHLQQLAKRLNRILEGMTKVMDGDLGIRIPTEQNGDELDVIAQYFNEMCVKLDGHIKKQYLAEIEQKNAEMDALQSQINPHFLYNTLDSIIWMAEGGKNKEVVRMTAALARLLRQSISNDNELISIEKEIDYAGSYLTIQKMRYRDKLEYEIEVDEEIKHKEIINLILQPLVENAIYHGIKYRGSKGLVRITGRGEGDKIILTVSDNGIGMDETALEEIFDRSKAREGNNGVGVYNVQTRIQLYYGTEYGLHFESRLGEGTQVTVTIPKHCREEGRAEHEQA